MSLRNDGLNREARAPGDQGSSPYARNSVEEPCPSSSVTAAAAAAASAKWKTHTFGSRQIPLRNQPGASIFDYFQDDETSGRPSSRGENPETRDDPVSPEEEWVSIDEATAFDHDPNSALGRQYINGLPGNSNRDQPPAESVLRFDDADAEYLSPDSDLDWDNQPFDYVVPMGTRPLHELNPLETRLPNANRFMTLLFGDRRAQQLGQMYTVQSRVFRGRIVQVYNHTAARVDRAVRTGQVMAVDAGRAGTWVAGEVRRAGGSTMATVEEHWPAVVHAVGRAGAVVQEGARSLPPLEPNGSLRTRRRR